MASQSAPYTILNAQSSSGELLHQILVELRVISLILRDQAAGLVADDVEFMYHDIELSAQKPLIPVVVPPAS